VFENRVLRRIFGPKRDEVMGSRRKLHNKEGGITEKCILYSGGKPEGERPLGNSKHT
jgi:hypothetical protein